MLGDTSCVQCWGKKKKKKKALAFSPCHTRPRKKARVTKHETKHRSGKRVTSCRLVMMRYQTALQFFLFFFFVLVSLHYGRDNPNKKSNYFRSITFPVLEFRKNACLYKKVMEHLVLRNYTYLVLHFLVLTRTVLSRRTP